MTGVTCKPICMVKRGSFGGTERRAESYARQRQQHDAAAARRAEELQLQVARDLEAEGQRAAEAQSRLRTDALRRLRQLGKDLDRLRRDENALLTDRDELILQLRQLGSNWNSIAAAAGLS